MPQLVKLLERANELSNQRDSEVLSVLADTYFAIAREKRDKDAREKALDAFRQATNLKPEDSALKTAYAAGLIFAEPAQAEKAIKQLEAALKLDPKNQNAMQLLVLALVQTGKTKTAEDKLAELKTLDANNPAIPELENQIAQQKASKKL
jgi:cytochrome c-type biogenesis protein CcmH/NrfG